MPYDVKANSSIILSGRDRAPARAFYKAIGFTIAVSDGITMGTEGMRASLVSRELIADSMELMARGHLFDALITLVACDKTNPAGAMALLRLNIPGLVVYGGPIMTGRLRHHDPPIQE